MPQSFPKISVLQWNMGCIPSPAQIVRQRRANLLVDLLERFRPALVTLQEAPFEIRRALYIGYQLANGPAGAAILGRREALIQGLSADINTRSHYATYSVVGTSGHRFVVTNLHVPVLWKTLVERQNCVRRTAMRFDKLRPGLRGCLEIHAGDFNLPPYDETIVTDVGYYANRCIDYARKGAAATVGRRMFNPTWAVLGGSCGALGTLYRNQDPDGPWHAIDQVFVDPRLMEGRTANVVVITTATSGPLARRTGTPSSDVGSDHFPLLVEVC